MSTSRPGAVLKEKINQRRGLMVAGAANALALRQATKRVVHNCEAPGGQPVFSTLSASLCGIDAAQEIDRRYQPTSVPPW